MYGMETTTKQLVEQTYPELLYHPVWKEYCDEAEWAHGEEYWGKFVEDQYGYGYERARDDFNVYVKEMENPPPTTRQQATAAYPELTTDEYWDVYFDDGEEYMSTEYWSLTMEQVRDDYLLHRDG